MPEVRVLPNELERLFHLLGRGERGGLRRSRNGDDPDEAQQVGRRQGQHRRRDVHQRSGAPRPHAPQDSADGAPRGDARHGHLGRVRVELLVDERPEGRQGHRADDRHMEIDGDRRRRGAHEDERPFHDEADGSQDEERIQDAARSRRSQDSRDPQHGEQ